MFEKVFRVTHSIAEKILLTCAVSDSFFHVKTDGTGNLSIYPKAKILIALKVLGFGVSGSISRLLPNGNFDHSHVPQTCFVIYWQMILHREVCIVDECCMPMPRD